jgi:hypothetical protein
MVLVRFPVSAERGDHVAVIGNAVPGQRLATNATLMPQLVDISGARVVGRDSIGNAVLEITNSATAPSTTITIRAAHPWPVVLGRVLAVIGLMGLLANLIAIVAGWRRRQQPATAETAVA